MENVHAEPFGNHDNFKYGWLGHYFILEKNKAGRSEIPLLRSLLHQFLVQQPALRDLVVAHLRKHRDLESSRYGLWEALQSVLCTPSFHYTVLVLDGLDELEKDDLENFLSSMTTMVANIRDHSPTHCIKFFATSRFDPLISSSFNRTFVEMLELRSENIKDDVKTFIEDEVTQFGSSKHFPQDVIYDIQKEILRKAEGTFLWASLAWADFKESVVIWSPQAIRKQLELLKKLPPGLEPLYETLLSRINPKFFPEIRSFFELIATTRRPLSCKEIANAMAIKDDNRSSVDLDVAFSVKEVIQRICPNLLQIDSSGEVTFIHLSFKDFLLGGWQGLNQTIADRRLSKICLTYLNFKDLETTAVVDVQQDFKTPCRLAGSFPFFRYAAQYFPSHMYSVPVEDDLWIKYSELSRKPAVLRTLSSSSHYNHTGIAYFSETPLQAAVKLNSASLVRRIIATGYDIHEDFPGGKSRHGTVLHYNIDKMSWVDLFLELGASSNKQDAYGKTPLHLAVERKLVEPFNRLMKLEEMDVNIQDDNGRTPVHIAAGCGNFLQTLLNDHRVRTDLKDTKGYMPCEYAALSASWGGRVELEDFLRFSESISNPKDNGLSPLIFAAQHESKDIVIDLIPKCLNINKHRGVDRKGILHWAAINNWDDVVDAAVRLGKAEVNQIDYSQKTALHYAAELGNLSAARCLLKHGATVHSKDGNGRTAAHAAAVAGFSDVLNMLLQSSDMDVNEEDNEKRTMLHWSATCDWMSIMSSVLDQPDLIITKTDCYHRNALHMAALCGCPNVFQLLLGREELDINDADAFGNTVLHLAARCGSLSVTEIVLYNVTSFQTQQRNKWGQSALDVAIAYNSSDVKERLQVAGVRRFIVDRPVQHPYSQPPDETRKKSHTSKNTNTCMWLISNYDLKRSKSRKNLRNKKN